MVFNVSVAISQSALNQLFQAYTNAWSGDYTIETLYNLWYYTNTIDNQIVICRLYYKYIGSQQGFHCAYANYDTNTGLYYMFCGTGNVATETSNGLSYADLNQLTLFYPINLSCFLENTKILTDKGYIYIQDLRKGDLVKTLKHEYKPICMIGKREMYHHMLQERIKNQLYKCSTLNFEEVFEPLIITGCHSILVDNFTTDEQRKKTIEVNGKIYITDNKYRLPACVDLRASVYETSGIYNIYHLALENNDYYMNYGIYANGLLVETCSKRYLKELSNMTLF
jgi:hypothetical protein